MNILQPQDYKIYSDMKNLAFLKFNLKLFSFENYLPFGNLLSETGLDLLIITKNIHLFIIKYYYNLNEQFFISNPNLNNNKFLSILKVNHVCNSIKTHGTGIMNTTVNYIYKIIFKLFQLFHTQFVCQNFH